LLCAVWYAAWWFFGFCNAFEKKTNTQWLKEATQQWPRLQILQWKDELPPEATNKYTQTCIEFRVDIGQLHQWEAHAPMWRQMMPQEQQRRRNYRQPGPYWCRAIPRGELFFPLRAVLVSRIQYSQFNQFATVSTAASVFEASVVAGERTCGSLRGMYIYIYIYIEISQGTTMTIMSDVTIITKCICMHMLYFEIQCDGHMCRCYLLNFGCLWERIIGQIAKP
jgi:hypothetical protein